MKLLPKVFKNVKGFTLIELLVVIGILAILLSIVLIAINPARQFGQANDTRRRSDVTAILNSIGAYTVDQGKGIVPAAIPTDGTTVDAGITGICDLIMPKYISAVPTDPSIGSSGITTCPDTSGYEVSADTNGRVTVSAPDAYEGTISVTR